MLVLSFPASLILIVLVESFVVSLEFPLLWFLAFVGGYLQWFWLLPKTFERHEITTLSLADQKGDASEITSLESVVPVRTSPVNPISGTPQFDKRGQTPLERVIKLRR